MRTIIPPFGPVSMADLRVGEELAGLRVVDDLVDVDSDAPIWVLGESLGSTLLEIAAKLPGSSSPEPLLGPPPDRPPRRWASPRRSASVRSRP
jgi:hypothetical protein